MAQENFYTEESQEQEVESFTLDGQTYTQEELSRLVGLGKIGQEAEQKYHTKLDKVWPQFQQTVAEKKVLEERFQKQQETEARVRLEMEQGRQPQQPQSNQPLSQEQIRAEALKQAEELGIGPKAVQQMIVNTVRAQQLQEDIDATIDEFAEEGLPQPTHDELLNHMVQNGISNPHKAYKDMYEDEYIAHQAEKLSAIRSKGIPSISSSRAGSRNDLTPGASPQATQKVTNENLEALVAAAFSGDYS